MADGASSSAEFDYSVLVGEISAGNLANADNVLIPLPSAVWSAFSVMGGATLVAGARRLRRVLK